MSLEIKPSSRHQCICKYYNKLSSTPPSNALDSYTVWADSAQVFASFQTIYIRENLEVAWVIVIGICTAAHSIYTTIHSPEADQGARRNGGRRRG